MNKIDSGYDNVLGSNYELCKIQLSELKTLAKSWYPKTNFTKFDERDARDSHESSYVEMKTSGLISNYFFAYKEGKQYFLLDGFNRLFTNYGALDFDCPVYVKVLTDKLADNHLMRVMFHLNMWKLQEGNHYHTFNPDKFFDRGFRLFMHKKFGIDIYCPKHGEWSNRTRDNDDFDILFKYFRNEKDYSDAFAYSLADLKNLMSQENIIIDIKELFEANNYLEPPFKNYKLFVGGFAMFLSWRRALGDMGEYRFQTYLDLLKKDVKFFKKLPTMNGNDCARKNIYEFFRNLQKNKQ